jgi:fibronectin type 3 domain-containing protein
MRSIPFVSRFVKIALFLISALAYDAVAQKPWKGAENITSQTFKYGAFETRLKSAEGGGLITTFFLWKNGSEEPGNLWQEMDFEIFGRDGSFQSQIMTPGKVAGDQRTEHVKMHYPTTPAHDRYNTYRMEWTPDSICFYYNGYLIRKETDKVEFAKLMDPAQAEAMQLRVGVWAGDYEWSGKFDSTAIPASNYANWVQTYSYTPGAGPGGSNFTLNWRDDFNSWNGSRWWKADWTFPSAINDYVSTNSAVRDGVLQSAYTHWSQMGTFLPTPIDDNKLPPMIEPLPVDSTPFALPGEIAINRFVSSYDNTVGNNGTGSCRSPNLDVDMKTDPIDATVCYVSSTAAGEWLEYRVNTPVAKRFDIAAKLGTTFTGRKLAILLNGVKVGVSQEPLANGWTAWNEVVFRGISIPAGTHSLRVQMETGNTNLKSLTVREWDPVVSLPGRVTVDAYVAYNDLTAGNSGGACRQDNVDMQVSSDIGGGCQISSTQAGEWVEYSTKFAEAGWYEFSLRLASYYAARTAKVFVDGSAVGTFTAPANGWQVFSSVVSAPIAVNAGTHTIRIQFVTGNTNTHYLDVTKLTGLPPQVVSGLAAVADNGFVDLTWNASIGATSYKVVRGTDTVATVTGTAYHDASVVNGTTYTYSVVGANSFGNAAASNSVTATPKVPEAPVGPTNLVAVAGDARVDLTWAAVSGATSYNVYRSIDGIAFAKVAGVANAQHLDATVLNGTTYSYYVTAMNESIRGVPESKPSDTVEATPRGSAPAKVTGLVATGDDSKVVLDWTPSVGANAYTIYRGVGSGAKAVLTVVSVPFYLDEAVANGVSYSYVVVASNVWGEAVASDPVEASPIATPAAPMNLVSVAGNATVSLTWEAGLNNLSYNVFRDAIASGTGPVQIATGLTALSYTDATVVNGTEYAYFVTGVNGTKESVRSNYAFGRPEFPTPEAPMNLLSVAGNATVSLTWEAGLNNLSYNVFRDAIASGTGPVQIATGLTALSYTDATVVNGTEYAYFVTGVNGTKESVRSNYAFGRPEFPTPEAPMNLLSVAGNATVSLTWEAGLNNLSYNVFRDAIASGTGPVQIATGLTALSYTDATVVNGTEYAYFVTGVNGTKESVRSNYAFGRPEFPTPEAPMNLLSVAGNATVSLTWEAGLNNLSYNVFRDAIASGTGPVQIATGLTALSYTDATVVNGTEYAYFVTGVNGTKESVRSNYAFGRPEFPTPEAPMNLLSVAGNATVSLTWEAGLNNLSYNVFRDAIASGTGPVQIATGLTALSYTDATVVNGTEYAYFVTGVNGTKESVRSNYAFGRPEFPTPEAPMNLLSVAGNATVSLTWEAGLNNLSYNVFRDAIASGTGPVQIATGLTALSYTDATVVNGTEYAYFVTGVNGTKESVRSNYAFGRPDFLTPEAPVGFDAIAGNGMVSLIWTAGLNNLAYNVYRTGPSAFNEKIASNITTTSLTDISVVAGTQYTYTVTGLNGTKESVPSLPASVVVGAAPAQVTGLAATAGDAVVNLTWNASAGPVSYKVLRATGNGAFVIIADVAVAAYQDLSVANGVEYTYAIGASNSYGDAEVSASAIALPDFATPTAPSALSALAGNGSVSLSWTAGSNNGKFNVYRAAGTSAAVRIATGLTTASYTDATVVNGTEYTYSVTGTNGTKESPASNLAIALPRGEVPAQVTGLVATAGNATVSLTWVAAARATSYKVVRGTDTIATVAAASYTDNAVVNGTTYSYSVVATNVWGNAPVSTSVSAKPTAPTAGLKAQYKAGNVAASTNGIRPLLQIVNTGTTSVALSQVTVRYWFTNDGSQGATYWCDWAQIGQTNLTGTVKTVSPARTGADRYLEIAFKTTAGNLAAGASTGEIQSRFSKSDWSNYTQTNDASYDPTKATSYVDWNRVTVYVNGTLVWGLEP